MPINYRCRVISLAEQKQFVAKVDALEKQIAEAQAVFDAARPKRGGDEKVPARAA